MVATLTIDDDVMRTAQQRAAELSLPIDRLVSDLLRNALTAEPQGIILTRRTDNGFPVFHVPAGTKAIALDSVREAEEEDDLARL